jgi:hypothetical protein
MPSAGSVTPETVTSSSGIASSPSIVSSLVSPAARGALSATVMS